MAIAGISRKTSGHTANEAEISTLNDRSLEYRERISHKSNPHLGAKWLGLAIFSKKTWITISFVVLMLLEIASATHLSDEERDAAITVMKKTTGKRNWWAIALAFSALLGLAVLLMYSSGQLIKGEEEAQGMFDLKKNMLMHVGTLLAVASGMVFAYSMVGFYTGYKVKQANNKHDEYNPAMFVKLLDNRITWLMIFGVIMFFICVGGLDQDLINNIHGGEFDMEANMFAVNFLYTQYVTMGLGLAVFIFSGAYAFMTKTGGNDVVNAPTEMNKWFCPGIAYGAENTARWGSVGLWAIAIILFMFSNYFTADANPLLHPTLYYTSIFLLGTMSVVTAAYLVNFKVGFRDEYVNPETDKRDWFEKAGMFFSPKRLAWIGVWIIMVGVFVSCHFGYTHEWNMGIVIGGIGGAVAGLVTCGIAFCKRNQTPNLTSSNYTIIKMYELSQKTKAADAEAQRTAAAKGRRRLVTLRNLMREIEGQQNDELSWL